MWAAEDLPAGAELTINYVRGGGGVGGGGGGGGGGDVVVCSAPLIPLCCFAQVPTDLPLRVRRAKLVRSWLFHCCCERCVRETQQEVG